LTAARTQFDAASQGEGHGHTDHEHKRGLDEIPEGDPLPRHMFELGGDGSPGGPARRELRESETAGREDEHDETAIGIEREITRLGGGLEQRLNASSWVLD
jgi:hypothetical protein